MTSMPGPESTAKATMRPNASGGLLPSASTTKVCTDDAHAPPARVTKVANKASAPVIGAETPAQVARLLEDIQSHRGHLAAGFETWREVQLTLGNTIKDLLQVAQKQPDLGPTVYPMLDSLKRVTDSGRAILDGSRAHLDEQASILEAMAAAPEEG